MPKYRTKTVVIDAERVSLLHHWAGKDWKRLPKWVVDPYERGEVLFLNHPSRIILQTPEGTRATADIGDLLICGVEGELYPCKPNVFAKTYELVVEREPDGPLWDETMGGG